MRSPVKKFMDKLQKPSVHKNKKDILVNTNSKDLIPFCYIKVSDDFGLLPSGNILSDGPLNFESFEIVFGQELKTSPKSLIDFKDCLAVGSSFLNQLAIFAINNNLKDKLNIVSDNNVVSDKYKKYLKTNKVE